MTAPIADASTDSLGAGLVPFPTPVHRLPRLSDRLGVDLWVKRDDLYVHHAGGNKARKMDLLLPRLVRERVDALVSTGSTRSNHARVVAVAAAQQGWSCELVLHGSPRDLDRTVNGTLLRRAGATLTFVRPHAIPSAVSEAVDRYRASGRTPYVIPGGGHVTEGSVAYVHVLEELHGQRSAPAAASPVIVVASGTGTTHAGLHVGSERLGGTYRVIGISIARPAVRALPIVEMACDEARAHLAWGGRVAPVELHDTWREGGYGKVSPRLLEAVRLALVEEGLALDTTYTGKAFLGLLELVRLGGIRHGSQVWFVITGGSSSTVVGGQPDG